MQGFNMGRYTAPSSLDPSLSTPSKRLKPNPGSKPPPTVRFEMPFAIWCATCPAHSPDALIGQGVRFNATKSRVAFYHSTPVWAFSIKHTACGGRIELRTDPQHHDFLVTEGARRRDHGDDACVAERTGGMLLETGGLGAAVQSVEHDPFGALEQSREKKRRAGEAKTEMQRVEELRSQRERDWRDPDALNRRLRAQFREGRRWRDQQRDRGEALGDAYGLGFEIAEGRIEDEVAARGVDFGVEGGDGDAARKPLFGNAGRAQGKVEALQREIVGNSRAAMNPFGAAVEEGRGRVKIPGLKKKAVGVASDAGERAPKQGASAEERTPAERDGPKGEEREDEPAGLSALVAYDSDD